MNRTALLAAVPDKAQWLRLSEADRRSAVVDLAISVLSECAASGRELDAWEAQHLRSALGALYVSYFSLGMSDLILAMAPPEERAPGWDKRFSTDIPEIHQLHRAFEQLRYIPVSVA